MYLTFTMLGFSVQTVHFRLQKNFIKVFLETLKKNLSRVETMV
ncbi:hypothetical protein BTURTLESOX_334 [bacterium endosymbiont of Bathymodiolus sp. 5 South]|nr:hypothetical protein [uncultured Gammaproteobacteria bacterium]SHN93196.1 hypothetical protein BCLUESOX_410 [bacterium endosymbiont of Bathymodiolus sp. 5 South]SSC07320.1 hypothetical protein BTURTLESOX_334 [bacterium endosymbiont of Bathymodiolus sp. 5 South]VVH56047.1 hypothetical protein BSPCLSOX_1695 [uncultured Gammaproteobacteria bacterium]VVH62020.1 hypothetical protein BSPWISOX_2 [uncultured Gammaproteobacteria bacterium]